MLQPVSLTFGAHHQGVGQERKTIAPEQGTALQAAVQSAVEGDCDRLCSLFLGMCESGGRLKKQVAVLQAEANEAQLREQNLVASLNKVAEERNASLQYAFHLEQRLGDAL